jgi:hypothetical protein
MRITRNERAPGTDRLVWDPAGPDRALAAACEDLRAGRFAGARDLLAATGRDWDLRCQRTLVLAEAASGGDAADRWVAAEPEGADGPALAARVAVLRAVRAHRAGNAQAARLATRARAATLAAAGRYPADPVPWVAMLHLNAAAPERMAAPAGLDADGPWHHVAQLWYCDRLSREGHLRLVTAVGPEAGGSVAAMAEVARWISAWAPEGSPLHLLPLLAYAEGFREGAGDSVRRRIVLADRQWAGVEAGLEIDRAYGSWFASAQRRDPVLPPDLHLLAHALWAAGKDERAAAVFDAIGPYARSWPWSLHDEDPERVFLRARARCAA